MSTIAQPNAEQSPRFDTTDPDYIRDPYQVYDQLRVTHPVVEIGDRQWLIVGSAEAAEALRDVERFTSTRGLDGDHPLTPEARAVLERSTYFMHGMFNADPPVHGRTRNLLVDFFSPRSIRRIAPWLREQTAELVDRFRDGRADIITELTYPLVLDAVCTIMGIPERDHAQVKQWSLGWGLLITHPLTPEQQLEHAHGMLAYDDYYRELLAAKWADPGFDAASVLAAAVHADPPGCTMDEAVVVLRAQLLAGHESASGLIGNTVYHLLAGGHWSHLRERPELIDTAVEEGLRHDPSVQCTSRTTTRDVPIGGVVIPSGDRVFIATGAIGRDPARVPDARVFRLDRPGRASHLAFGFGLHFCLGSTLTKLEVRTVLEVLLDRFPDLRLDPDRDVEYAPGGRNFHTLKTLPVLLS